MEILAVNFTQAYSKTVMLCVIERANRKISKTRMAKIAGVSLQSITSFEDLRIVNLSLLEDYIDVLENIKVKITIKKETNE